MDLIETAIASARRLTPTAHELTLVAAEGGALPDWLAGAHVEITLPPESGVAEPRAYALTGDGAPGAYRIAVERRPDSRGASRFLCEAAPGTGLRLAPPRQDFRLNLHPAARVLIAGGIGVAPIYAMVCRLARDGLPFALHCLAESAELMPYRAEIEHVAGAQAKFHFETRPDFAPVFAALPYPAEVYICGTRAMNDLLVAQALDSGLSRLQVLHQCFEPKPVVEVANSSFEVELRQTGLTVQVPPDASILETVLAAGYPAQFYCGRGECGFCPLPVLEAEGPIEHRDHFLSPDERVEQMCICVSRLKGAGKIVLDA